jgi:hypothetical protein
MTDNQAAKSGKKQASTGRIVLIGAIGTVLAIINLSTNAEAPSQGVLILEYVALAGGFLALVGGLVMMMTQKS